MSEWGLLSKVASSLTKCLLLVERRVSEMGAHVSPLFFVMRI